MVRVILVGSIPGLLISQALLSMIVKKCEGLGTIIKEDIE